MNRRNWDCLAAGRDQMVSVRTKDWTVIAKPTNVPEKDKGPLGAGAGSYSPGVKAKGPEGRGQLRTPSTSPRARMVRVAGPHRQPNIQPGRPAGPRSGAWLGEAGTMTQGMKYLKIPVPRSSKTSEPQLELHPTPAHTVGGLPCETVSVAEAGWDLGPGTRHPGPGTRDPGPFAAVLAPGHTSPPAAKYKETIRD